MKRSKLIFLIFSIVFLIIIILVALDFGRRTTAPWQRHHQSTAEDSAATKMPDK